MKINQRTHLASSRFATYLATLLLFAGALFLASCGSSDSTSKEESGDVVLERGRDGASTDDMALAGGPVGDGFASAEPSTARTEASESPMRSITTTSGKALAKPAPMMASLASTEAGAASISSIEGAPRTTSPAKTGDMMYAESETDEKIAPIDFDDREIDPEPAPDAGQLTSGEWSDLREWDYWTSVIHSNEWKKMIDHWGFGQGTRISVRVDNGREPIVDATVTLKDKSGTTLWVARSDNHGRVELFTGLENEGAPPPYDIVVEAGGKKTTLGSVDPSREQSLNEAPLVARLDVDADDAKRVDVMFSIDATGSMGDELRYIKAELESVIERVADRFEEDDLTIRLGANVYRDESDEYLVRETPLTENVEDVLAFLRKQSAGGGGDTPEAVEVGLEDAIEKKEWSKNARARLLFLVLDAPPHYTEERLEKLRELTRSASAQGIRVIGVSSSGVDKETEFLMRFLGIHTGGTYTFLTDHSGIGESHIEPTIGSHAIEFLDNLMVRLIVQYTDRPASIDAITPRVPEIR